MKVNYAAVHTNKPWRKHSQHATVEAAVEGKDGAKALLMKRGRIANMWDKWGDVLGVFVWTDGSSNAQLFRLDDSSQTIEECSPSIDDVLKFDSEKFCSDQEITKLFQIDS